MWRLEIEEIIKYIINPLIQASIFTEEIIIVSASLLKELSSRIFSSKKNFKEKKMLDEVMPTTVCGSYMRACSFNLLRLKNPRGLG